MLKIDGSQGEGGGQILRTSLTMAMLTGTNIKLEHIRAGRNKPGLMRQHLACVKAAQSICDAEVSGAEVDSTSIMFKPNAIRAGEYDFSVGTAGSTTLIFQTVLPALAVAHGESRLKFYGGTHNMMAPSFDFIALAFIPILQNMGIQVDLNLKQHGFYPQGGGEWEAIIQPGTAIKPFYLLETGELKNREVVVSSANIPEHIAIREIDEVAKRSGWSQQAMRIQNVKAMGSGNIVSLRLAYATHTEVIEHVGKVGISAERVARNTVRDMQRYQTNGAVIGEYLADQLLLPMVLARGGAFRALKPSLHCRTNKDVIHLFIDQRFNFTALGKDLWEIRL